MTDPANNDAAPMLRYTLVFDVEVARPEQLGSFWLELHDPPPSGLDNSFRTVVGGTEEQRARTPRVLAKRMRRTRRD